MQQTYNTQSIYGQFIQSLRQYGKELRAYNRQKITKQYYTKTPPIKPQFTTPEEYKELKQLAYYYMQIRYKQRKAIKYPEALRLVTRVLTQKQVTMLREHKYQADRQPALDYYYQQLKQIPKYITDRPAQYYRDQIQKVQKELDQDGHLKYNFIIDIKLDTDLDTYLTAYTIAYSHQHHVKYVELRQHGITSYGNIEQLHI